MAAVKKSTGAQNQVVHIKFEDVPISSIRLWKNNPRTNDLAAPKLAVLLKEKGQVSPVVVWIKNKVIYKGNTTYKAMVLNGASTIRVQWVDFIGGEGSAIAYGIADNKSSEWSEWDDGVLSKLLSAGDVSASSAGLLVDSGIDRTSTLIIASDKEAAEEVATTKVDGAQKSDGNQSYDDFLKTKIPMIRPAGFQIDISELSPKLFDFQRDITRWSVMRGRSAIFAGTGLGKTWMQLEWARVMESKTKRAVLIVAPLAVVGQTISLAKSGLGIDVRRVMAATDISTRGVYITNYERIEKLSPLSKYFSSIVLDESSILKMYAGAFRTMLVETTIDIPYKLCCTATPAPNDYMELGNHAEFLGVMTRAEMLAMYFVHDGARTSQWRVKGHAKSKFWEWIATWAVVMNDPSDLGYNSDKFKLPKLVMNTVTIGDQGVDKQSDGIRGRMKGLRDTLAERCKAVVSRVASTKSFPVVVWCQLNDESSYIAGMIDGAIELKGGDSPEVKEKILTDFSCGRIKVLVTKPSLACFGMNWQHCHYTVFAGISDSFEEYYQAIRRFWRFGQKSDVTADFIITPETAAVLLNVQRKEYEFTTMQKEVVSQVQVFSKTALKSIKTIKSTYKTAKVAGKNFALYLGDCVDVVGKFESNSIDYSIFSPPFRSLYTYSDLERDMGNTKSDGDFNKHMVFLVKQLFRVIRPGRNLSFHCMNLPTSKVRDGYIGISDFRGELIKMFQNAGFIYHSEVCIWKDPVTAMQRTKALGLLHKQLKKDACMSRQGIPDYLVTMRKPGINTSPVRNTDQTFPVKEWQEYASPVWMDIKPGDTLQKASARENDDERHICPLQLDVIRRAVRLWSIENDTVLSPFMGIGSEGYVAVQDRRKFVGVELKESYFNAALVNMKSIDK